MCQFEADPEEKFFMQEDLNGRDANLG